MNNLVNFTIAAKDRASLVLSKIGNSFKRIQKTAGRPIRAVTKLLGGMGKKLFSLPALVAGFLTAWGATSLLSKAISKFNQADAALRGLSAVADRVAEASAKMGAGLTVDAESAKAAAASLAKDGLLTVSEAALGLKNLLLSGFGLSESVDLLNAFKDSAAFGRQGALSFGQAIISASEGIKNENSILLDNAGITKNISILHKEYAASINKTVAELNAAERAQGVYKGVLAESAPFLGNAKELTETYQGKVASLNASLTTLAETVGKPLTAALAPFIEKVLLPMVKNITQWVRLNDELITQRLDEWLNKAATAMETVARWVMDGGLVAAWNSITGAVSSFTQALQGLVNFWTQNQAIMNTIMGAAAGGMVAGPWGAVAGGAAAGAASTDFSLPSMANTSLNLSGNGPIIMDNPVITGGDQGGW